jgi:hypothetical protein
MGNQGLRSRAVGAVGFASAKRPDIREMRSATKKKREYTGQMKRRCIVFAVAIVAAAAVPLLCQ